MTLPIILVLIFVFGTSEAFSLYTARLHEVTGVGSIAHAAFHCPDMVTAASTGLLVAIAASIQSCALISIT